MALSATTLRNELIDALDDLTGTGAPDAVARVCQAWGTYFKAATVSGAPPVGAAVDAGVAIMETAMTFTNGSSASDGANIFKNGVLFFWAHVQANASTYWPGTTIGTSPTTIGTTMVSSLTTAFNNNNDDSITRSQAATNMANALHTYGGLGGILMIGPTPTPVL